MKKVLKLLLMVAPLLTDARLYAPIIEPPQLAPEVKVVLTPNFNPKGITATITDSNKQVVNKIQRLSTDPITFDKPGLNLEIVNNTILTPLVINDPKNFPTITIKKDASSKNNFYYIESIIIKNPKYDIAEIEPFMNSLKAAINDNEATIFINDFTFNEQIIKQNDNVNQTIHGKSYITKDIGLIRCDNINDTKVNNSEIFKFNDQIQTTQGINFNPNKEISNAILQGFKQASQEKLDVNEATKENTSLKAETQALYTIARLKGITNPETLNDSDKYTIKNAITDYLKLVGNGEPLPNDFLLQFNSIELQALSNMLKEAKTTYLKVNNIPENNAGFDLFNIAVFKTTGMIDPLKNYRSLQEDLANRLALDQQQSGDGTAVIDWYINLSSDDQLLLEYDYFASVSKENILNMDPNKLGVGERAELTNYINILKSRSTNSAQIKDLQDKLDAINKANSQTVDSIDKNIQLTNKVEYYDADPNKEQALLDWSASLSTEEQNAITTDVQGSLLAEEFQKLNDSAYTTLSKYNPTEILNLKQNFEKFLLSSDETKNAVLDNAIAKYNVKLDKKNTNQTNVLSSDTAQAKVEQQIAACKDYLGNSFSRYFNKDNGNNVADCFNPQSTSEYARIFKSLSFEEQYDIVSFFKKNNGPESTIKSTISNDLATYQKALIPERIASANTTDALNALEEDMIAALIEPSPNQKAILDEKFSTVQKAENEAEAAKILYVPETAPSNEIIFNPTKGQNVVVNTTTGGETPVLAGGGTTNPADAAAQAQIAQEDPELAKKQQDKEAKEAADAQEIEDAAKTQNAMQDAIDKANREGGDGGVEAI